MTRIAPQNGYILLPVVLAIALVAVIAFMMNNESAIETGISSGELKSDRVRYLAEAGLNHALWQVTRAGCGPFTDITDQPFGSHSYSAAITPNTTMVINSYTVPVSDDAWINDAAPTQNYANDTELSAYKTVSPASTRRALYRFDIENSGIPAGVTVVSAVAKIFVTNENETGPVTVHRTTADWSEASVNWDSINSNFDSLALATIPSGSPAGQYVPVNITALVQGWVNGSTANQGIMLLSDIFLDTARFSSKEYGNTAQRPLLEVTTTVSTLSNRADITVSGTLANGTTHTLNRYDISLYQPSDTLVLQPGAAEGMDTYLYEWKPDWNHGASVALSVTDQWTTNEQALLRFDLSAIPTGARIAEATLELHSENNSWGSTSLTVHRVNNAWSEGSASGGTGDGASWNNRDTGTLWNSAGGDYEINPVASAVTPGAVGWMSWDIAALVDEWVNAGSPNYGLLLAPTVPGQGADFDSSDNSDPTVHPKLTITYRCACGITCFAPRGSGNVLMAVINPGSLVAADTKKKALFESWGYTVNVISESENQSKYDAEAMNNDVIYISNTVNSNNLGGILSSQLIGVINEDGDYNADLGTSSSYSHSVGKVMAIIDTSHYITSLFPAGDLPIYSANMEVLLASGTPATNLQVLANDFFGAPGLAVVETGGLLADGSSTAAGRRVMLPLGRNGRFNWDYLNNNGRLMVQRAIQWGVGDAGVSTGPAAHWKLDETIGTTAADFVGSHDGTVSGAAWSSGLLDGALGFNGVSDYVDLGTPLTLENIFDDGATITAWINPAGWGEGDFGRILDKADNLGSNRNGWAFELYGSQQALFFQHGFSGAIGNFQTPAGSISLNSWQHVAVVFDNNSDLNDPTIYIDGAVQTVTETSTPSGTRLSDSGITLTMGNYFIDFSRTFAGLLDDVRIYDRMLTEAEIAVLAIRPSTTALAHWTLDDGSGGIAVDSVGAHDGTLVGDPTWSTGVLGGALDFDGVGDRVDVGAILDAGSPQISVMAWVFKRDTGDDRIISKSSGGAIVDHVFSLGVAGTTIRVRLKTTDNGGISNYDGGSIALDQWVHVAFTYDGGMLRIYMDGTETASYAVNGDMIPSTLDVAIGNVNASDDRYWNGLLDDVRIYDWALTPAEITALSASGCSGAFLDEFNSVSYAGSDGTLTWTMDWLESGDIGGESSGDLKVTTDLSDNRLQVMDKSNSIEREVDLTGAAAATLTFDYRRAGMDNTDESISIEVSADGGNNWTSLEVFAGPGDDTSYQSASHDISGHISANTRIRFISSSKPGNDEGIFVDNVKITCTP